MNHSDLSRRGFLQAGLAAASAATLEAAPRRPNILYVFSDMQRAYSLLTREWLRYIEHLKNSYPYIYSLAVRLNPYKGGASPVIED